MREQAAGGGPGDTPAPLYSADDTHWSVAGNALAATLIARQLERQLAPPGMPDGSGR